jgi:hypothetical protein
MSLLESGFQLPDGGEPRPEIAHCVLILVYIDSIPHLSGPVLRKNLMRSSRGDFLEPVLMMKSAENRGASNRVASRQT